MLRVTEVCTYPSLLACVYYDSVLLKEDTALQEYVSGRLPEYKRGGRAGMRGVGQDRRTSGLQTGAAW